MTTEKKKKKAQQQQVQQQEQKEPETATGTGSVEYLTDHKFDRTIKTLQANILQHNQSKKLEIIAAARLLEKQGYPLTKICDRITKALQSPKYETSGSYVRKVLPAEYKDPEQMATAFQQKHTGDTRYRQQEQFKNKDIKEFTEQDIKVANPAQLRKVAKHQMQKALWWEQQAKQSEAKAQAKPEDNEKGKQQQQEQGSFEAEIRFNLSPVYEDVDIIANFHVTPSERKIKVIGFIPLPLEAKHKIKKSKKKSPPKLGKMGKPKDKMAALQKLMAYQDSRIRGETE